MSGRYSELGFLQEIEGKRPNDSGRAASGCNNHLLELEVSPIPWGGGTNLCVERMTKHKPIAEHTTAVQLRAGWR